MLLSVFSHTRSLIPIVIRKIYQNSIVGVLLDEFTAWLIRADQFSVAFSDDLWALAHGAAAALLLVLLFRNECIQIVESIVTKNVFWRKITARLISPTQIQFDWSSLTPHFEWSSVVGNTTSLFILTCETFQTLPMRETNKLTKNPILDVMTTKAHILILSGAIRWQNSRSMNPRLHEQVDIERWCHPVLIQILLEFTSLGEYIERDTADGCHRFLIPKRCRLDCVAVDKLHKIGIECA